MVIRIYRHKDRAYLVPHNSRRPVMFNRKQSQVSFFQIAIGSSLVVSVAFVVTILVEAVAGMQSYL